MSPDYLDLPAETTGHPATRHRDLVAMIPHLLAELPEKGCFRHK